MISVQSLDKNSIYIATRDVSFATLSTIQVRSMLPLTFRHCLQELEQPDPLALVLLYSAKTKSSGRVALMILLEPQWLERKFDTISRTSLR
jgi:hypothetical protein